MTGIIDYGCGNMFSLVSSLKKVGENVEIFNNKEGLYRCDRIILPGVGAFGCAAEKLECSGLSSAVKELAGRGVPLLGICLGMQLLFEKSSEYGEHRGLSLLCGSVGKIDCKQAGLKLPHMGWNSLRFKKKSGLFRYVEEGEYVYFVHSYHAEDCSDSVIATVGYGAEICAAAGRENVFGTQFHPEKSGDTGLRILKAFTEI